MTAHWRYLSYVLRHKWFVFLECWAHGLIWRGLIHDWSKFLPCEWGPYAARFYSDRPKTLQTLRDYSRAWNHHQKVNDHHWQYWLLTFDTGQEVALEMPERCVVEMICDWRGAGRAQGKPDTVAWYRENRDKMRLHDSTRQTVEQLLGLGVEG